MWNSLVSAVFTLNITQQNLIFSEFIVLFEPYEMKKSVCQLDFLLRIDLLYNVGDGKSFCKVTIYCFSTLNLDLTCFAQTWFFMNVICECELLYSRNWILRKNRKKVSIIADFDCNKYLLFSSLENKQLQFVDYFVSDLYKRATFMTQTQNCTLLLILF